MTYHSSDTPGTLRFSVRASLSAYGPLCIAIDVESFVKGGGGNSLVLNARSEEDMLRQPDIHCGAVSYFETLLYQDQWRRWWWTGQEKTTACMRSIPFIDVPAIVEMNVLLPLPIMASKRNSVFPELSFNLYRKREKETESKPDFDPLSCPTEAWD